MQKVRILNSHNIPIWVMEPVRGGRLARLDADAAAKLKALRPEESLASWAMRWLQRVPGVTVILSGMSDMPQMMDNVATFEGGTPLSDAEVKVLEDIAASMTDMVPCTACRYCCDGCPAGLDIPALVSSYNDLKLEFNFTPVMYLESLPEDKLPSACLGCGACKRICPQGIDIPQIMSDLSDIYGKSPKWSEICVQRHKLELAE